MNICLEADSILKSYGERTILSDIYLRCKPGDITALWGRNGSGKSTLLEIIFGTLKAEHAFVRVGDRVVNGQAYRTGLVAFLPQFHFLPGNLRVAQLLRRTGLQNLPEAFGDMPVPPLRERLKNLSGGQLRLLEILYVTSLPAPFLLLDEPFAGLSPVAADTIARHLQARRGRGAVGIRLRSLILPQQGNGDFRAAEAENLGMRRSIKVEGRVKVVFIDGIDAVACGGVHLKSTGEIGEIQYVGSEKIRGHVRTIWKCGKLSVDYRHRNRAIVQDLSSLLSSDSDNLIQSAERLVDDNAELRRTVRNLERKIAVFEIEKHKCSNSPIVFSSDVDIVAFEDVFDEDDSIVAFVVDGNGRFMFHGTKEGFDSLKSGLSIKGGGRGMLYRGSVSGNIDTVLEEARKLLNG